MAQRHKPHPIPPRTPTAVRGSKPSSPALSTSTPTRLRTLSTPKPPTQRVKSPIGRAVTPVRPHREEDLPSPSKPVSIREQIALKRAEAKKGSVNAPHANSILGGTSGHESLEDAVPTPAKEKTEDDMHEIGRWSVKETIDRGRSTGSINLSSRSLLCLPSALFEVHLGVTPEPLKLVPKEPPLPSPELPVDHRRGARSNAPSWFEAQDLQILKAWNNEIVELQPEISLFGSLKTVDLHNNKLTSLPDSFADLMALTFLDLSHNGLDSLPKALFALPNLATLNISHNALKGLPFGSPFTPNTSSTSRKTSYSTDSFFSPQISRATTPLPRLVILNASHNKIAAEEIDQSSPFLPQSLQKLDLSDNPLGSESRRLLQSLAQLPRLTEVRFKEAEIEDASFPVDLLFGITGAPFPSLQVLDLGKTKTTVEAVKAALQGVRQELRFNVTSDGPHQGAVQVIVGKVIIKEPWEVEADQKAKLRKMKSIGQGLPGVPETPTRKEEIVKEGWELEAEQGLLTEGGRRRARAAMAAAAAAAIPTTYEKLPHADAVEESPQSSVSPAPSSLSLAKYYTASTLTLTLTPSAPPSKLPKHGRAISFAVSSKTFLLSDASSSDLALPAPTLPLTIIAAQPFAETLKVLVLDGRRFDRSMMIPVTPVSDSLGVLPRLEELSMQGCDLEDSIAVSRQIAGGAGAISAARASEPLLSLLSLLFPSLRTLDLSENRLTSASLTASILSSLVLAAPPHRAGLRHLRLRGNRLAELDGLTTLAQGFRANRDIPRWALEELDVRDNEIGRLPAELGMLSLDVFLVDGNTFRVPQRRIWEREGTKGLLSWLRGRME